MTDCETHLTESGTLAFRVALSVLRHREDAEDVAQEAVVRSLQRFDSLRDRTRFRAWLVRVAWRLALDRRRSDTRRFARDSRLVVSEDGQRTVEHDLIQRERADRLWVAIDGLPARLRLPLLLGTLQGNSLDDVALLLDVPVGTVKSRLFEARRQLKKVLVGTGVVFGLIGLVTAMSWPQRTPQVATPATQSAAVASAIEVVTPRLSRSETIASAVTTDVVPTPQSPARPTLPGMTSHVVLTIEIPIVETKPVRLPTVHVPVVGVPNIEVPAVKMISPVLPDTHPEKQR